MRALKSCGFKNAAMGLAAAWLLVWVLVMALIFFTVAASMPAAARAAKCRRSPAAGTNASRFMTRPRAASWGRDTSGPRLTGTLAGSRSRRNVNRLPPYLAALPATEQAGQQHRLSFTAPLAVRIVKAARSAQERGISP